MGSGGCLLESLEVSSGGNVYLSIYPYINSSSSSVALIRVFLPKGRLDTQEVPKAPRKSQKTPRGSPKGTPKVSQGSTWGPRGSPEEARGIPKGLPEGPFWENDFTHPQAFFRNPLWGPKVAKKVPPGGGPKNQGGALRCSNAKVA